MLSQVDTPLSAIDAFSETISLKVKLLRKFIPKKKEITNTDLTGSFIEEMVYNFVDNWIGNKKLIKGTFHQETPETALADFIEFDEDSEQKDNGRPFQIDGIVYDPTKGPLILSEGRFGIVHPAFCSGIIEIKMSHSSIPLFHKRLNKLFQKYFTHRPPSSVMGIVIADSDPEKVSQIGQEKRMSYSFQSGNHPIFVLFKETEDGDYKMHEPAIELMIRAIYNNFEGLPNAI
jgi:hypothetical protein